MNQPTIEEQIRKIVREEISSLAAGDVDASNHIVQILTDSMMREGMHKNAEIKMSAVIDRTKTMRA